LNERTTTIAIVDDDPAVRRGISGLLRSLGFAAVDFSSAEAFLNSGRAKDMSCVITDVRMPGMSGIELQDRLIAAGHKIPVIFMTAFPKSGRKHAPSRRGPSAFSNKPFAQNALLDCVHPACAEVKSGQQPAGRVHAFNAVAARVSQQQAAPSSKHLIKINTAPRQSFCP